MLLIFVFLSLEILSFQLQEQTISYILPKKNQLIKDVITNLEEKISKTSIIGFGIWFKWQPLALLQNSNVENVCQEQFIMSLENQENKLKVYILSLKNLGNQGKLNVFSDFLVLQEEIILEDYFEGVWVFFNSLFDFTKNSSTFFIYQSITQELSQYKIDEVPVFQNNVQYQIGNVCDQCTIQNFQDCFSPFKGRLSILFEQENFEQSSFLNYVENGFTLINDCVKLYQEIIIGNKIYDGDFYQVINLGILEQLFFQLNGWVKIDQDVVQGGYYQIFKIVSSYEENLYDPRAVLIVGYYFSKGYNSIDVATAQYLPLTKNKYNYLQQEEQIDPSILMNWHFIQIDVGYPNQARTLKLYSSQLDEIKTITFDLIEYTGQYFGLNIGGYTQAEQYFKGNIANLEFQTFCQPQEQDFILKCHYTCQTCFGPFYDNCLTCQSSNRRYLKNNQCVCESDTFQFQEYETCQTINGLFQNLIVIEEELLCKKEGYDVCNDIIICSYGYFKYKETSCIQCPYYNQINSNSNILCINCLIDPEQFSMTLTCTTDSIVINQSEQSTFESVLRNQNNIECYEIKKLNNEYYLQLIKNKISKNPPHCRIGYYYENEQCYQCSYGCIECNSPIMCSKCEEGYYLDLNNNCAKCQNCLKCEVQQGQYNCLSCPQKYYLQNQQCLQCGQFCADCRSNGYCNYCIDSQKYFISIDGINCLICNISNCKYCYQQYEIDNQIIYTSFDQSLENYTYEQSIDNTIYCAKCQEGYILDLNTNTCIKRFNSDTVCQFGSYDQSKNEIQCLSEINVQSNSLCNSMRNCKFCVLDRCIECEQGYYIDLLALGCQKCPLQCENCIFQNNKLIDNWKIEILARYAKIDMQSSEIQSDVKDDYEIQCISCLPNFILYNSNCIQGCSDGCQKCEIIEGNVKCVECNPFNNQIVRSIDQNGQCLKCQNNCEQCLVRSIQSLQQMNKNFIQNQDNSIYTRTCYKSLPSTNGKMNFINQLTVIDCKGQNKCKRKGNFNWNIYCDEQQYQNIKNKNGIFQEGNYYFNDFFGKEILSTIEISNLIMFLNEQVIEQIDIIINIFQGNVDSCKPLKITEQLIKIHSTFMQSIFFLKRVNLKVSGQQQNVLLEEFIFDISGFQQIQFENLNFLTNQINITDTLMNSISFINCSFGNDSPLTTINPYNLNLKNVTIQITNIIQNGFFQFNLKNDNFNYQNIKILIDGLRIINSKFQNTKLISINTEIGPKISCQINNLELIETEFDNSFLFTSSGLKNIFFGDLIVTEMKVDNVNLKNSSLFYLPNVFQLNINSLTINNLKIQSNSYLILSNQLNFFNFYLNEVDIDKSYLFSNKVPLLYQTTFSDLININLNKITIKNVVYNSEQSLLQVIKYNNYKVIVILNYFKIHLVGQTIVQQNFISQEKSSIHISCSQCYFDQVEINRKNGIPEISIIDSELIIISNSFFTQNQKQASDLIDGCQNKVLNSLPQFIYIGQYEKIKIENLTIIDAIGFNYPFIIFKGIDIMQRQIFEDIEIVNSNFENNNLITSESNSPTSIIQIDTKQKGLINLTNLTFYNNHLNMEYQDLITKSSSTLLIDNILGNIFMKSCKFEQNIITNSTDSILYLKAKKVEIIESKFIKNNILNFSNLSDRIQLQNKEDNVNDYYLQQVIKVQSNGGSGYILTNYLNLKNCTVVESHSLYGGAFYINTFGDAQILIEDSTFIKTRSSLLSSASSYGGCFYIDAQLSTLTLLVKNTIFNQSYSRSKGGCFYIVPSNTFNFLYFEQINVTNSFSIISQFFDYSLQNLNDIISNVTFYKIQIVYDKIAFNQFLSLLDKLSSEEATDILNNSPIIKIKYGNVTINSVFCQLDFKIYFSQIDQGSIINFNEIYIEKGFIWNSPLMNLNLKSGFYGELMMQNIKIYNLLEFQEMDNLQRCQEIQMKNKSQQVCISPLAKSRNTNLENNLELMQQITLCQNQNLIFQSEKLKFSLIVISNININHQIIITEMLLNQIICRNCQYGLLGLTNIHQKTENNIILNGINVQQSLCGTTGCLSIINKNSNNYLKTNQIKKESRILQEKNFEALKFTFNFQVSLSDSIFVQNKADYGGAVCIIDIDILINLSHFKKNTASVGGAIYSFTSAQQNFKTIIISSYLIDNQAKLAADIYLENQMLQQNKMLNVIMENNSTIQGSNIFERPRSLAISTNNGSIILQKKVILSTPTQVVEKTIIKPYKILGSKNKVETLMFPSGQIIKEYYYFDISTSTNIPYNLSFRIIALNKLQQREDQLNGQICNLKHQVINLTDQVEIEDFYAKLSLNQIAFNTSTLDFNLDNFIVYFNPYYDSNIVLRLFIQCDMIQIPVYSKEPPYLITNLIKDYQLYVDIKTFPCQLGEYFNSTNKICIKCNSDQSQYQVQQNATICSIKDETKIKSVESEKIELKQNYWRAYFYSTKIEECYHLLENCLGGWQPGDKSCSVGHIGALCEQCDLYNIRGDGHFSTSSPYKCGNCDQIEGNAITISLISLWTLISVLMSVNSTIETINQFIAGSKLILFGVSSLFKQSSTAVLIKLFTNYLQIIQTILTFQLQVPAGFTQIFASVGNPIEQVAYSLDCFLIQISDISIIYFRIIWSFLMAISYILTFFIFLAIAILVKQLKFNISMISTALIYIFIFLQPNIIQSLISLVSFRVLSNISWVQGNVAYLYDTTSHKYWMISFCLPILMTFSILIPLFMFCCIRRNRNHLEQIKTRERWGYLYNEYKLKAYYWEFIKIFQKELIIIFLAYYEDFIAIKASLVFLVIFAYSLISNSIAPYMTAELNRFDTQSTIVCAVSIILGSSIYTAQNQNFIEIVYPFYIIIALLNGWFLLKMIINIFLAYFDQLYQQIDKLKEIISEKFPDFIEKHPQAKKLLESKRTKLQRIKSRFAKIKQYLMAQAQIILKLKIQSQINPLFQKIDQQIEKKTDQQIQTNDISIKLKSKTYSDIYSFRSKNDQQN